MSTLTLARPTAPKVNFVAQTFSRPTRNNADAVARLQAQIKDEVALQENPTDEGLYLRKNAESFFLPQDQAKGTVVLYHGFTAGPWQYREMADKLHDSGYNVYAPRMPGHGMADASGKASSAEMPTTGEQKAWSNFAQKTFDDAANLGVPVHAVGLSGGGNVALEAASKNSKIDSVTALAPFLGSNGVTGVLFPVLSLVDVVTFGLFGKLLDRIPRKSQPSPEATPKTAGTWGNALAMYRVGANVDKVDAPLQLITTAKDPLSGTRNAGRLLERSGDTPNNGWFHFPEEDHVQHAMVSPLENPNKESIDTIQQIITDFVGLDRPTNNRG